MLDFLYNFFNMLPGTYVRSFKWTYELYTLERYRGTKSYDVEKEERTRWNKDLAEGRFGRRYNAWALTVILHIFTNAPAHQLIQDLVHCSRSRYGNNIIEFYAYFTQSIAVSADSAI
jgi:hypothetical protein